MASVFSADWLKIRGFPEGEQSPFHKHTEQTRSTDEVVPNSRPGFKNVIIMEAFPANLGFVPVTW